MKGFSFQAVVAVLATSATAWLGGWDDAVKFLVAFMVIDYVTGLLSAFKKKEINSEVMFWGGIRKGAILVVIAIAVMLDQLIGNDSPVFRTMAIYYYIAREILSITENYGVLGLPMPDFIRNAMSQLESKAGASGLFSNAERHNNSALSKIEHRLDDIMTEAEKTTPIVVETESIVVEVNNEKEGK